MKCSVEAAYREHGALLYRYLVRLSGDADLAADLLQDTFRTLLERPPENASQLRGWLVRVATNRFRDVRRAEARRRRALKAVGGAQVHSDPPPSPEHVLRSADAHERARRMLEALPERDRCILLLREEGFTHREIAEAVGTTTGSVGTMIARALDRLVRARGTAEATP